MTTEKLNNILFLLIVECVQTNATTMTIRAQNVTKKGEQLGDWSLIVENISRKFKIGDSVQKTSGSEWHGTIVGYYSTKLNPIGYAVESVLEKGSVQIYPEKALTLIEHHD